MLNKSCAKKYTIYNCCTSQDILHVPPEYRRFRRVHGLQLPLHPQQVTGWILLVVIFVGTFIILTTTPLPFLLSSLQFILLFSFATLFLVHVLAHLTVLLLDPADPEVRARPTSEVVPEFNRNEHRHVIENDRCHLCNITIRGRRTKHCSICNKCVPRFDHHCKWLNNCIGGRNYPAFLVCLISTLISALAVAGFALSELVLVSTRGIKWNERNDTMNNATALSSSLVPGAGSIVLVTVIGVLSAIAAILLIHLCFFHGYIAYLGLTTYEYVRNKREKSDDATVATAATTTVIASSRVTASCNPYNVSRCIANKKEIDKSSSQNLHREKIFEDSATTTTMTTTDVYVCSLHENHGDLTNNDRDACSRIFSTGNSRNFHLCFSYDSRSIETSIEVSSHTTTKSRNHEESETKFSSTPSPVSCCFPIMNSEDSRNARSTYRKCRTGDRTEVAKRSCDTMRRIQTFLHTRLRKSTTRQKSTIPSSSAIARSCNNKIIPIESPLDVASVSENQFIEATELSKLPDLRPPAKLPALDLPPRIVHKISVPPNPGNISVLTLATMSKRNQTHIRTRRKTFSRKKPHFKVGSHVTQTAQLSPIPESEFSKPVTPRSPSRSGHFTFPSLRE